MNDARLAREGPVTRGRKAIKSELGHTGTLINSGIIAEEYLAALKTTSLRANVWERMRADAQVAALLSVIVLPLQASNFFVKPSELDPDQGRAKDIADRFEQNLKTMTILWDDFIRQAFLSIAHGFSLFEIVYRSSSDGSRLFEWEKFAPRAANTITSWDTDGHGELLGVEQQVWTAGKHIKTPIPVEKLLLFTYRQEGSNFEGRPILRDAYKHWFFKDMLYKTQGIGAERNGSGFPVLTMPRDVFDDEADVAEDLVRSIRVAEEAGLVIPDDYTFDFQQPRAFAYDKAIEHHNRMIALAGLTQFLTLGSAQETGSYALSRSHGQFFVMAVGGILRHFTDTMNHIAFRKLVDINWGTAVPVPELVGEMIILDPVDVANVLVGLIGGDLLRVDDNTRKIIRERLQLPPEEEDAVNPLMVNDGAEEAGPTAAKKPPPTPKDIQKKITSKK